MAETPQEIIWRLEQQAMKAEASLAKAATRLGELKNSLSLGSYSRQLAVSILAEIEGDS